jgi:CubicO group peptidase (beta-lactamase class C family)
MSGLEASVDRIAAETRFSGVVWVDRGGDVQLAKAYGLAHRGHEVPNTVDTQFGIASGTKGLTALTVVSLIEEGRLAMTTSARSVLGEDLPLIDDKVTVEHLLAHRSGIGDYFDEELDRPITDYVLAIPVHELDTTERFLRVLDGYPSKFAPDERFSYCNGGYVVLALIAERSSGTPFHELVEQRVCGPAGMRDTRFLARTSSLAARRSGTSRRTDRGPTSSISQFEEAATAASTPPQRTSAPCGAPCSPDVSCLWSGSPRWCVPTAKCRRNPLGTAWGSGSTSRATSWSCTDTTQACPSEASTILTDDSPTR